MSHQYNLWADGKFEEMESLETLLSTAPKHTDAERKAALLQKRASGKCLQALMDVDCAAIFDAAPQAYSVAAKNNQISMRRAFYEEHNFNGMQTHLWFKQAESAELYRLSFKMGAVADIHTNNVDAHIAVDLIKHVKDFLARIAATIATFKCPSDSPESEIKALADAKLAVAQGLCFLKFMPICRLLGDDGEINRYTNLVGHVCMQ